MFQDDTLYTLSAFKMTYIVPGGALNSTHSLTLHTDLLTLEQETRWA